MNRENIITKYKNDVLPNANKIYSNRKVNDPTAAPDIQQRQNPNAEESRKKGIIDHKSNVNNKHANVNAVDVGAAQKTQQDPEARAKNSHEKSTGEHVPNAINTDVKVNTNNSANASHANVNTSHTVLVYDTDDSTETMKANKTFK